ncbi:cell division topological specificity factor MinE [Blochmannia endosymbiont of Camponotus sp.]|uniref:cell division topological specificity factor MinE n=1 Tax=Blochmannia endosymbiont of Camponotus sp. TaxID=700220 RepID=UPI0020254D98|nr:cell division topological specificity factor MinE [Blochmannia endosymbiont of Camponotus sp.]URJ29952.1 cell division topological specificity factor MinE [Blochmannia endosymbiont of Camponotus sp.]
MVLVNFLFFKKKTPANIAKRRLQDVISENNIKNISNQSPCYLYKLKKDLTKIIRKYIPDPYILSVQLEKKDNASILKCKVIFSNEKHNKSGHTYHSN